MATGMKLPPGFVLEGEQSNSQDNQGMNLPAGFQLEQGTTGGKNVGFDLPSINRQQSVMAQRPDLLTEAVGNVQQQGLGYMANPMNILNNLKLAGGLIQRGTSAVVNPMIAAQRASGDTPNALLALARAGGAIVDPRQSGPEILAGLKGQTRGETGDVFRGAGAPEPVAALLGLATEGVLTAPKSAAGLLTSIPKIPGMIKNIPAMAAKAPSVIKALANKIPQVAEINALKARVPVAEKELEALSQNQQRIKKISSYLKKRSSLENRKLAYEGAKSAKDSISQSFLRAKENYRNILFKIKDEKIPLGDANRIVQNIIEDLGLRGRTILDDSEKALLDLEKQFQGSVQHSGEVRLPTGENVFTETNVSNPGLNSEELKIFKNVVRNAVKKRPDIEARFYKGYGEMLEANGMSELTGANKMYSEAYKMAEDSKILKQTKLSQVGSGKIPVFSEEFSDLARAEKTYGTDYTQRARKLYEKYRDAEIKLAKEEGKILNQKETKEKFIKELITKIDDKKKAVQTALRVAEILGIGGLATLGIKRSIS